MLECHGRTLKDTRVINLFDTWIFSERIIEVGTCPICGKIKARMTFWDNKNKRYSYDKPKRRESVAEWVRKYEKEPYRENIPKVQQGSWINMQFHYQKNGNICDLNDNITEKNYNRIH